MQPLIVLNASDQYPLRELLLNLASAAQIPLATYASADALLKGSHDVPCGMSVLDVRETSDDLLLRKVVRLSSHARVVLVGDTFPVAFVVAALKHGCTDVLVVDGKIADALLRHLQEELQYNSLTGVIRDRLASLSQREREVLRLMLAGASIKQLALRLGIAGKTARIHAAQVLKKMNVENAVELTNLIFLKLSTNLDPRLRRWFPPSLLQEQHV